MNTRDARSFRMRACQRCGGDAFRDRSEENEWRCLQCGRLVAVATSPPLDRIPAGAAR